MEYYKNENISIYNDNCLNILKQLPDDSVDSIVTDPPAGISFMNKDWDSDFGGRDNWIKWMQEIATECLRVIKPGGHGLIWAIPRTSHWTATAWENAGFEIRDVVAHIFGSGFPKSLNIGKAVDKLNGFEITELPTLPMRDATDIGAISKNRRCAICGKAISSGNPCKCDRKYHSQNEFGGWGTALKPAREDWILIRKPISEKTIAQNVIKYGTGGINIDGCRVETNDDLSIRYKSSFQEGNSQFVSETATGSGKRIEIKQPDNIELGRFPANIILSIPLDTFTLRENLTTNDKEKVMRWLSENS